MQVKVIRPKKVLCVNTAFPSWFNMHHFSGDIYFDLAKKLFLISYSKYHKSKQRNS